MDFQLRLPHDAHATSFPAQLHPGRDVLTGLPMLLSGSSDTKVSSIQGVATDEGGLERNASYGLDPWHNSTVARPGAQCQFLQGLDFRRCSGASSTTEPSDIGGGRDSVFSCGTEYADSWFPSAAASSAPEREQQNQQRWPWELKSGCADAAGTDRRPASADIGDGVGVAVDTLGGGGFPSSRGAPLPALPAPPGLLVAGEQSRGERQHIGSCYDQEQLAQATPAAMAATQPMYHQHFVSGVVPPPFYDAAGWSSGCGHLDSMNWHQPPTAQFFQQQQQNGIEVRTTVMLRNLPDGFSRDMLTGILNGEGFAGLYDFIYMPMNFRTKASFGYAFVNMVSPEDAERCHQALEGFIRWRVPTSKVCEVSWSDMHQGLAAHVDRYRNSPVMHESVPDEYKPVMYSCGVRVVFPPPTKKLRVPRIRRSSDGDRGDDDLGPF